MKAERIWMKLVRVSKTDSEKGGQKLKRARMPSQPAAAPFVENNAPTTSVTPPSQLALALVTITTSTSSIYLLLPSRFFYFFLHPTHTQLEAPPANLQHSHLTS